MVLGRWSLERRPDGDFSLYEEVSAGTEGPRNAVERVERFRCSFGVFWLCLAGAGRAVWLVRDAVRWLKRREKRHKGHR